MKEGKINFIAFLRVPAVLMVLYDHLGAFWSRNQHINWWIGSAISKYVSKPLCISEDFGFLGVTLFFLVSGFVIGYVIQNESSFDFLFKRFFRIYPPLLFSLTLIAIVTICAKFFFHYITYWNQFSFERYIISANLFSNFFTPHELIMRKIDGVSWTLTVEFVFYLFIFFWSLLYAPKKKYSCTTQLIVLTTMLYVLPKITVLYNFNLSFYYISYLLFGQLIYFYFAKRINFIFFIALTIINYYILIKNTILLHPYFINFKGGNSHLVSFFYAYAIFLVALFMNEKIRLGRLTNFFSNISYSLYLNHFLFAALALSICVYSFGLNYTLSFLIASIISVCISYFSYRYVELSSIAAAKK
jgi:peptidoglycan/LPS O-acetylase OafA/YrhL